MMKSNKASLMAWRGDWRQRIGERVRKRGHAGVTEFIATAPTKPLVALASELDEEFGEDGAGDVAAEQVERILIEEARARGDLDRCARGLLLREIHTHLPEGWHAVWVDIPNDTTTSAWRRAMALSGWYTSIALKAPEHEAAAKRITAALRDVELPDGWLPRDIDDPVLGDLFGRLWKDA